MSYDNAEPKILKTLNSDGQVLDDSGNVISEEDYWQKLYNEGEPKVDKILHSDGTIKDGAGNLIQDSTPFNVKKYNQSEPIPAKYLHSDGTIDENPGSGSGGGALNLYTTELPIFEGTFVQNPEEPEVTNTLSFYAVASDGSLLSEISDIPNAEFLISAVGTYETSTVWRKDSSSQPPLAIAEGLTYEDDQSFALMGNTIIINSPYNSTPVTVTVTKAAPASTYLGNYLVH